MENTDKGRDFTECKTEALDSEVKASQPIFFGGHSSGVTNKSKFVKSQHVTAVVNAASSESRIIPEIKEKWLDMKVDPKKDVSVRWQNPSASGGARALAPQSGPGIYNWRQTQQWEPAKG